jgi:hypothetical protein
MAKRQTANERARAEARRKGFEFRPTTAEKEAEAERLNRGLEMLAEDGRDEDVEGDID